IEKGQQNMSLTSSRCAGTTSDAQFARAPRLKLPDFYGWVLGQVAPATPSSPAQLKAVAAAQPEADRRFLLEITSLRDLAGGPLPHVRTLSAAATPRSARHAMVMFRPAIDRLARHLSRWYGCGDEGLVIPPCTFPMELQTAIMRLAEVTQSLQDWDSQQPDDR